jgi:hypothetical protein
MNINKCLTITFLVLTLTNNVFSQNIALSRITDWKSPGCSTNFNFQNSVSLISYGADSTGVSACDSALQQAINALNGAGEIFVTKGVYLFNQSIILPDSIIIQGEVDTSTLKPMVNFKLSPGNNNHGIVINGSEINTNYTISYPLIQGNNKLYVSQPQLFSIGDIIRLKPFDDSLLVNNSWAYHSTGQIFEIVQIDGDSLILNKPLRRSYSGNNLPVIYKLIPRRQVHIKCIKIERMDSTTTQSSNIYLNYTADCSFSGIESYNCNYAHIDIRNSIRISVENSFFKDGFSYGGDGKAYGIMLQSTSGDCFIHQNNFEHLRHSMILQSGANGNVLAYNYSKNPFWSGTSLPSNSAGDLVFHGNYVYMNLMEGNVVQNIVIDNSHGINGPYNTFYRNRAELYGIFMNNSPASNGQNFIGNQVTNTTSIFLGFYTLQGINHFEYGNMILGFVTPDTTNEPNDTSMFAYTFGSFYKNVTTIPPIKNDNWYFQTPLIESNYRNLITDKKAICDEVIYLPSKIEETELITNKEFDVYPNPFANEITIKNKTELKKCSYRIYNTLGKLIHTEILYEENNTINLKDLNNGMYFIQIEGNYKNVFKILKQ